MISAGNSAVNATIIHQTDEQVVRRAILAKLYLEGFEQDTEDKRNLFEKMSGLQWKPVEREEH